MAEIGAERRRDSVWTWILGVIVLALLIWVVADAVVDRPPQAPADDRSTQGARESRPPEPAPPPWPVAAILDAGAAAAGGPSWLAS
jgi:hypothetical protein